MTQHVLLDNVTHKHLKIRTERGAQWGDNISLTGVFPDEFREAQHLYPLFFKKDPESGQFSTVALLGFESGENLFLHQPEWQNRYIPLSVQRQPFLIGFQTRTENGVPVQVPVVHIDLDHPRVSESEGEPVFLEHGGTSPLLEHASSVLMAIHQGHQQGAEFSQALADLDLIEPFTLQVTLDNGQTNNLQGLYTINEEKVAALPAATLAQLHQQGYLQHIYMLMASISNIRELIAIKNAQVNHQ